MSQWSSLSDIMRDLSVAQGNVPASLETLQSCKPPPNPASTEDDESDYHTSFEDIDFSKPPDFYMIQKMLNIVHDKKNKTTVSNKDTPTPEYVPQTVRKEQLVKDKRRQKKNVAMTSILEAQDTNLPAIQESSPQNMFRKKNSPKVKNNGNDGQYSSSESTNDYYDQLLTDGKENGSQYTPSNLANEYYNKFLSNNQHKEEVKEDIWERTERQLRELDKKRKQVSESSAVSSSSDSESSLVKGFNYVHLLYHRHIYLNTDDDCVVCKVAAKHGYHFTVEDEPQNNIYTYT
ncbi:uncharacterized protein LOC142975140 [Anticarsia gemmatalis]|uniref:uncharacterized protein LOC142975140 n=1 Tax=Anticarsia gemmatalis TaxID=129554 RepID=UPI003F75B31C